MIFIILIFSVIITFFIINYNYLPATMDLLWQIPLWFVISFISLFLFAVLLVILFSIIVRPKDKNSRASRFLRRLNISISRAINQLFGLKIKTYNLERLPSDHKYLVVSNHQSNLDPLILIDVLNNPDLIMIMKDNMMKLPFISQWLTSAGFLPLNRDNNREALKTISEGNKWVSDGMSLGVYPEGTRSKDTKILPLKSGIFRIALKAQCPIVVCTSDGMHKIKKHFPLLPTRIYFKVSRVISYDEIKDLTTNEIGDLVHSIMDADLKKARQEIKWLKKSRKKEDC